ncbi:BgTH12-05229 [Blumeria graminis f. sp. triticale]|uniref:Bgt-51351 n=2 Tax=Blumeria graminis TaxID=34373 RepID=A0A9X9QCY3_BLUGR|nr:BgTH12-05229 [Blumeria graminis f. sp. triticale]VDB88068.1 Bgt-51351 [Blumeria graminis f. sp. tritici]
MLYVEKIDECGEPTDILPIGWKSQIAAWYAEDCPSFDYAGLVVGDDIASATLYGKTSGYVAGVPFFNEIFALVECKVKWWVEEGDHIHVNPGEKRIIATVTGPVRKILLGERIGLNLLSRSSGIATMSGLVRRSFRHSNIERVLVYNQTTPGFKLVESYAMKIGGVNLHDQDPSMMIMLSTNHVQVCGSVSKSIKAAKDISGNALRVWVEVDNLDDATQAAQANADVIIMRSLPLKEIVELIKIIRKSTESLSKFGVEVIQYFEPEFKQICNGEEVEYHHWGNSGLNVILANNFEGAPHIDFSLKLDH